MKIQDLKAGMKLRHRRTGEIIEVEGWGEISGEVYFTYSDGLWGWTELANVEPLTYHILSDEDATGFAERFRQAYDVMSAQPVEGPEAKWAREYRESMDKALSEHAAREAIPFIRPAPASVLPTDSAARKQIPLYSGLMKYFPRALAAVAHVSYVGNEKHNPGQPLHWARGKSTDQEDCIMRHLMDHMCDPIDHEDGTHHAAKLAWRALALLELTLEDEKKY